MRAGPACRALIEAAERGKACDETLAALADRVGREPDERACILAARRMISTEPPEGARVRSAYEPEPDGDAAPLSEDELAAVAALRVPASLVLVPDVGRVPGIPPTTATLEALPLDADLDGRLSATVAPGVYSLRVRHAGRETAWCLDLQACQTLELTTHAAQVARHPGVAPGLCVRD